jgi:hypothetical protein
MEAGNTPEPRRHHFVPQCWLAGFTDSGEKDGELWVTDLARKRQWKSSPGNAGHIRDFYRLSDDNELDPVIIERAFSKIEGVVAPVIRALDREQRAPTGEEFGTLLPFIALQWARVPQFRPLVFGVLESVTREKLAQDLKSEASWKKALRDAGIPEDAGGAEYEAMLAYHKSQNSSLTVRTEWYIQQTFKSADHILPILRKRAWRASFSPSGSFIGTDNPVVLDGPKGKMLGFKNAQIISYVVSRHVLFYSTQQREEPPFVNQKYIAAMNRMAMLRADQVFSALKEFCWLDQDHTYQTDWTRFARENFLG